MQEKLGDLRGEGREVHGEDWEFQGWGRSGIARVSVCVGEDRGLQTGRGSSIAGVGRGEARGFQGWVGLGRCQDCRDGVEEARELQGCA